MRKFLVLIMFILFASYVSAQTIYVNSSTGDDTTGDGGTLNPYKTFHKGYTTVTSGGTLDLTGIFTWTDADELGDVATNGYVLGKNITIQGQGASSTIIQAASTANSADRRIFTINSSYTINIKDITLRHGNLTSNGRGGAISIGSVTTDITIDSCILEDNTASSSSYSYSYGGGAIYCNNSNASGGQVIVKNSIIRNNTSANCWGGAIYHYRGSSGTSSIVIENSTINGNTAAQGTVLAGYYGAYKITNSTITGNSGSTSIIMSNHGYGQFYMTNVTFAYNSLGTSGRGLYLENVGDIGIKNSILAQNKRTDNSIYDYYRTSGTLNTSANNIIEVQEVNDFTNGVDGNIVGEQNCLGLSSALDLNGSTGISPTLALTANSIAINGGTTTANGSISIPALDQRGTARLNETDIGAYEFVGTPVTPEITVGETSLSGFDYSTGSGPSDSQTFDVSGIDLVDDIEITAPSSYEVSDDDVSYSSSITLTQVGGTVSSTLIYVRLKSGLSAGAYNEAATVSTACDEETVTLNGTVAAAELPTVTTQAVILISSTTATGNGTITDLGFPNPTAHGICWSIDENPTTSDSCVDNGAASATGAFLASMNSLTPGTLYYVRAYATNSTGTSYGTQVNFTTLKITPTVTAWPTASAISYGQALSASVLTGGTASVEGSFAFDSPVTVPNVGTVDYAVTFIPTNIANYNTVAGTVSVTTNKAIPVITWNDPADIDYGTALDGTQLNATADVAGSFVYTPAAGTVLDVGFAQALKADFTPADMTNYEITSKEVVINVATVELTVTADDKERDFSAANPAFTITYSGFVNADTEGTLDIAPVATTTADIDSPAGDYQITVSGGVDNNYTFSYVAGNLKINAVAPSVTTGSATDITINSAKVGGTITSNGGLEISAKGVCISETENPDNTDTCLLDSSENDSFIIEFTSLTAGTIYHARAFATNSVSTTYGNDISFTTVAQFTLTYTAGANGSLSGALEQTVEEAQSGTAVTAVADTNYHFVDWSDGVTDNPRTDTNVTANINVTANFEEDPIGVCERTEEIDMLPYTHNADTTGRDSAITSYGSDCLEEEYASSDYVYSIDLELGKKIEIELDPADGFDGVLVVVGTCGEDKNCVAAVNDSAEGEVELVQHEALGNETLFIVVEGVSGDEGEYTLEVRELVEEADDDVSDMDEAEDMDVTDETEDMDETDEEMDDMDTDVGDVGFDIDEVETTDFDNEVVDTQVDVDMIDNYKSNSSGCSCSLVI